MKPWPSDCFDKFKAGEKKNNFSAQENWQNACRTDEMHQSVVNQMSN